MMLFINPVRDYLGALAPDPLTALINVAELAVVLLTVAYLIARIAVLPTFPVDDAGEFFSGFFFAIILASIAMAVLGKASRCWRRRRTRRARERLYERLRSQGNTPERSAALVGIYRALASVYTRRQSFAMTLDVPAGDDIVDAALRRMPAERRGFLDLCANIALGALFALATLVAYELLILALASDELPFDIPSLLLPKSWNTILLASRFFILAFGGAAFAAGRLILIRQRDNLRRNLERCRDAGLDGGSAALLLTQTPALISNDKKATAALRAAN